MKIEYMRLAISEAEKSFKEGNYPIGAVLIINDKIIEVSHNSLITNGDYISHAEMNLLNAHSKKIKSAHKKKETIDIYTTLEPCMMCYSTMLLHHVKNIYISCPDPHGGFLVNNLELKGWYLKNKPNVINHILFEQTYNLMINFLELKDGLEWKEILKLFINIKSLAKQNIVCK
jgi:tRNA(adenine34) deaminase